MQVNEARDLNQVLQYLLGIRFRRQPIPSSEQALAAAQRLTQKAYIALDGGLLPTDLPRGWPAYVEPRLSSYPTDEELQGLGLDDQGES